MGDRDAIRRAAAVASGQHGNLTYAQLLSAGLSPRAIGYRCEAGWLIRRHTGVYAVGHVPAGRESAWHAGVLALGEGAVLSHASAGGLWGLMRGGPVTEVIVPTDAGRPRRDGIVVHRQRLPPEHATVCRGIPVTTPVRTLVDLAGILGPFALARAFEEAQVRLRLAPAELGAEVISRPRRRGNAKLRRLLVGAVDPAGVRSVLELRFLRLCEAHGIPRPLVNVRIGKWTPDFLWPERGLVVETDGTDFHRTAAARRRDALKDEFMRGIGLEVIRLTWADAVGRPAPTARAIHAARGATNGVSSTAGGDETTLVGSGGVDKRSE